MGRKSRNRQSGGSVANRGSGKAKTSPNADKTTYTDEYLAHCYRGQELLDAGNVTEATEVFRSALTHIGAAPSYGKAVVLERLGRCLLLSRQPGAAAATFREALDVADGLAASDAVQSLQGTLQSNLGDTHRANGHYPEAKRSYETALHIAMKCNDLRAQCVDFSHLGALAMAEGKFDHAQTHFARGLALCKQLSEPATEAVACYQLAGAEHAMLRWHDALHHYGEAERIHRNCGNTAGAARCWQQLGVVNQALGRFQAAETWYRKAIAASHELGESITLGPRLSHLANLLQNDPARLAEAQQLVEQALSATLARDPTAPDVWKCFGLLADIHARQAHSVAGDLRTTLQRQAQVFDELYRRGPRIVATLARLGATAGEGTAVILGQLGRCYRLGAQANLAITFLQEALNVTGKLTNDEELTGLRGMLMGELGEALVAMGQLDKARQNLEAALEIAAQLGDLRGQAHVLDCLGALALASGEPQAAQAHYDTLLALARQMREPATEAAARAQIALLAQARQAKTIDDDKELQDRALNGAGITVAPLLPISIDEICTTEYVFDTDLLIDGRRVRRVTPWTAQTAPLADSLRPTLAPFAQSRVYGDGSIGFNLAVTEPQIERRVGCTIMRRVRREATFSGMREVINHLLQAMDGTRMVAEIMMELPTDQRDVGATVLACLAATGVIDTTGRPIGRFLHAATKKGVVPGGGLSGDEVLLLATDGRYRQYPQAPQLAVGQATPERLRAFHDLTRLRRSRRDYNGRSLRRDELDALLHTACGVTGAMNWADREVKLRAYPSSGALYAVGIYPIVFRVESMAPGVYHFRATDNMLELTQPDIDQSRIVSAMLPVEREMVSGAAAMICLTGCFTRHERKYGQGGYRMMIAEAGHVSQNLVLAATALGLSARPFGGVFDDLLNQDLGLDASEEQFLLSVLVGHSGDTSVEAT